MKAKRGWIQRNAPFLFVLSAWLVLFAVLLWQVFTIAGNRLVYASDDVYIHMALAKNIALYGVWGVTRFAFASCASSLIWPVLIALAYRVLGLNEWLPLALNVALSLVLLWVVFRDVCSRGRGPWAAVGILSAYVLCLPLAALVFDGLEHVLQAAVFLLFAIRLMRVFMDDSKQWDVPLAVLACALTAIRYEGLFLAGAGFLLLIWQRRWKMALILSVAAILPVVSMGLFSLAQGWYPIPTSVLIKSAPFTDIIPEAPWMTLTRPFRFLSGKDYLLSFAVLILGSWILFRGGQESERRRRMVPGVFFLIVAVLHGTAISLEWFYRHAAYLVGLGIWAFESSIPLTADWKKGLSLAGIGRWTLVPAAILLGYPFLSRAAGAISHTPLAVRNIYEMQYQMADFLRSYYPEGPVAANDIGAVAYFNDFPLLDLYGLSSMEVAQAKINGTYDTAEIARLVREHKSKVVIVYDYWFTRYGGLPEDWIKVAEWRFQDCYVCGGDTVTFYAVDNDGADRLLADLKEFRGRLPARVEAVFLWRNPGEGTDDRG